MYRGIVTDVFFDLDHTLWDFELNSRLTFEQIFLDLGLDIPIDKFLSIYIPLNREYWKLYRDEKISKEDLRFQRLQRTLEGIGFNCNKSLILTMADAYIKTLSTFGNTLPHSNEVLSYLSTNYRLHIITNGFQEIQANKLRNSGIAGYFDVIMDSEKAGVKKPNPKIFNLALKQAGTNAEQSIMIGDDLEADVLGAQAVGMKAIHLKPDMTTNQNGSIVISNLIEIKDFL